MAVGGLTTIGLIALAWLTMILQEARIAQEEAEERLRLTSDVVYFDEVLTMSTWVFATSGDTHWVERYEVAERELTRRLERLMTLTPLQEREGQSARETAEANDALIALERRARELTRGGALKEAQAVLTSAPYLQEKERYQRAILNAQREAALDLDALRGVGAERLAGALMWGGGLLCLTCLTLAWSLWARRRLSDELSALEGPLSQLSELEGEAREASALAAIRQRAVVQVTRELVEVEQHERRRLGQALHDELQPLLAAARMQVSLAGSGALTDRVCLERADELLGEALSASRGVMLRLMPPYLNEGDLARALDWLSGWLQRQQNFTLDVCLLGEVGQLGHAEQVLYFQAIRECALNTLKHSGVRAARVTLDVGERTSVMRFEDSGRGVETRLDDTPPALPGAALTSYLRRDGANLTYSAESYGLRHLSERARALGGELLTRGGALGGFCVYLSLPMQELEGVKRSPTAPSASDEALALRGVAALQLNATPWAQLKAELKPELNMKDAPDLTGVRALIVDDNERLRGEVRSVLTRFGCEWVEEAGSGVEAVALDRALEPDVVLMDITLPRLDGLEATRRICAARAGARVVVFSTHCAQDKRADALAAGACAYLEKGVSALTLGEVIRAVTRPTEGV